MTIDQEQIGNRTDAVPQVLQSVDAFGVATYTLNRPERHNAWNPVMEREYYDMLAAADRDDAVRVGVVTGSGSTFCPGVDVERLDGLVGKPMDLTGRLSPTSPLGLRKPLIAAINGACAGMGLVQALMTDVRFAARGAKFTTAFARRGLAAEYGIAYVLPHLIGVEHALDLLLSGRVVYADEALEIGLVSRVVEPEDVLGAAQDYARDIAQNCSPISLALIRHQVWTSLDQSLDQTMSSTYRSMAVAVEGRDFREGLDSFLQRRTPSFQPLQADLEPSEVTGTGIRSAFEVL